MVLILPFKNEIILFLLILPSSFTSIEINIVRIIENLVGEFFVVMVKAEFSLNAL